MDSDNSRGSVGGVDLEVGLRFHKAIDYDRRAMRKALASGAAVIRKNARRLVSRRAISNPGEFPGMQSGALRRAIGVVSRGSKGGWVKVGVRSIPGHFFHPASLYYGSQKIGLAKRGNYMEKSLSNSAATVRSGVREALKASLVPR